MAPSRSRRCTASARPRPQHSSGMGSTRSAHSPRWRRPWSAGSSAGRTGRILRDRARGTTPARSQPGACPSPRAPSTCTTHLDAYDPVRISAVPLPTPPSHRRTRQDVAFPVFTGNATRARRRAQHLRALLWAHSQCSPGPTWPHPGTRPPTPRPSNRSGLWSSHEADNGARRRPDQGGCAQAISSVTAMAVAPATAALRSSRRPAPRSRRLPTTVSCARRLSRPAATVGGPTRSSTRQPVRSANGHRYAGTPGFPCFAACPPAAAPHRAHSMRRRSSSLHFRVSRGST